MHQGCFVEDIKGMLFCPLLDPIPIMALMLDGEVRFRSTVIVNPIKGQERNVGLAHQVLAQIINTMIYANFSRTSLRKLRSKEIPIWIGLVGFSI